MRRNYDNYKVLEYDQYKHLKTDNRLKTSRDVSYLFMQKTVQ